MSRLCAPVNITHALSSSGLAGALRFSSEAILSSARLTDQALERRKRVSAITRRTVPNTAALTFVGVIFSDSILYDEQNLSNRTMARMS